MYNNTLAHTGFGAMLLTFVAVIIGAVGFAFKFVARKIGDN